MHICMDEIRLLVAALSDPVALFTHAIAWFRGVKAKVFQKCDHSHVEVISSRPPRRDLVDILANPPRLELIEAWEESQILSEFYIGPPGLEFNYIECTGAGCLTCRKLQGLDEPQDTYDAA